MKRSAEADLFYQCIEIVLVPGLNIIDGPQHIGDSIAGVNASEPIGRPLPRQVQR